MSCSIFFSLARGKGLKHTYAGTYLEAHKCTLSRLRRHASYTPPINPYNHLPSSSLPCASHIPSHPTPSTYTHPSTHPPKHTAPPSTSNTPACHSKLRNAKLAPRSVSPAIRLPVCPRVSCRPVECGDKAEVNVAYRGVCMYVCSAVMDWVCIGIVVWG